MQAEIRSITADEVEDFLVALSVPFAYDLPEEDARRTESIDRMRDLLEPERTRCAFVDGEIVGTLATFSLQLTVPGGVVPAAGTTMVGVHPTHRRQGVLRRMMAAHLDEARDRGDAIAALWASDSAIYGRFGYGMAAAEMHLEMPTAHSSLHRLAPEPAPVRAITGEEAARLLPVVYDRVADARPGFYRRSPEWWRHRVLRDEARHREGATAFRFAVADGGDGPLGYVSYRMKQGWTDNHGDNELRVSELFALTPEGWAGLWSYVLSHDLTTRLVAPHRPLDDPLLDLLAAPRRASGPVSDALWVRILDVPAALSARAYPADGSLVLEVLDEAGGAGGRWRLAAEEGRAECRPTDEEPHLRLDVEDLGSAYLGRSRFGALARAGRLEGDEVSLRLADRLFAWDPQPWCPEVF